MRGLESSDQSARNSLIHSSLTPTLTLALVLRHLRVRTCPGGHLSGAWEMPSGPPHLTPAGPPEGVPDESLQGSVLSMGVLEMTIVGGGA